MYDDLISRQAVIEINRSYHGQMPNEVNHRIWKEINELPSAQPEPCGDVVSRNAIIQKLNTMDRYVSEELRLCDTDKKFPKNEVFIVDDIYEEIVEKLPSAQSEPPWILVTEQMPERNLVVLVTTRWDEVTEGVKLSGNAWFIGRGEENAFDSDIIAWMPKPKPYKEWGAV